ncbi:hypothetical protein ABFS82_13G052300 [Erythranthe guttata]
MDRISELPNDVLRKILYFLSQKEATRTSVLSKQWRYIWCTRPNLDFTYTPPSREDGYYYRVRGRNRENKKKFLTIVDNTLQRYHDQDVCVEEFHLSTSLGNLDYESVPFLEKWSPVLKNTGTKKFHLSILSEHCPGRVELPPVVFGSESLQLLHVERFLLDEKSIERLVPLKHLKSLTLQRVSIKDEVILRKIISNCPSIEILDVHGILSFKRLKVVNDLRSLKKLKFYFDLLGRKSDEELCSIEIHHPSLETINISNGVESSLCHLSSCEFPSLENLEFFYCDGLKGIRVFIDAPNMVYFEYSGNFVPSISIATFSKEWESCICISCTPSNEVPLFFVQLKEMLELLSQSKIYLDVDRLPYSNNYIIPENNIHINGRDGDKYVVVENLNILFLSYSFPSSLNGFLSICRPRYVGEFPYYDNEGDSWAMEVTERLWKILTEEKEAREDNKNLDQFKNNELWWFRDLEEVKLEVCHSNRDEWHATTLSELPNCDRSEFDRTRFALKWRET